MQIEIIGTESLGNRGYLIHDGRVALAVDVQRDYKRWLIKADEAKVTITHVLETHMHNDYVTGGYQLARQINAEYIIPSDCSQNFSATEATDGDERKVGNLTITAIHTPGHTPHHMSFAVTDGQKTVVCTGGGLLYGTVGRSDLISSDRTQALAEAQHDSAHKLVAMLPGDTAVLPTHGFGSFCSSSDGSGATASTLESEAKINVALTHDKDSFVKVILEGLGPYPKYYAQMGPLNQAGPEPVKDLHIHEYVAEDIASAIESRNSWVIDTRSRTLFSSGHPDGAVGIELGKSFATYTGWIIPWADTLLLVGENVQSIRDAYLELSRIGMDAFVSGATHDIGPYLAARPTRTYDRRAFKDLRALMNENQGPFVVDVRLPGDWETSHVETAVSIPLHEMNERIDELPKDTPIWVHCASGYRASIAASLIDRSGRTPVLVDDSFDHAVELGLTK